MFMLYIAAASIVLSLALLFAINHFASRAGKARLEGEFTPAEAVDQRAGEQQPSKAFAGMAARSPLAGYLRWLVAVLAILAAGGGYWALTASRDAGKNGFVDEIPAMPASGNQGQANSGGDLNTVVKRLADKMANDPNNGEGWVLLAKTYGELRRYREAAAAYEKAAALVPPDAGMYADWADAYVMAHDRKWDAASRQIVKRALNADPKHVKTLALAGSEAFDRGDFKGAIEFWKRMKAAAPADSMDRKLADANIAEATAVMSGKKPVEAAVAEPAVSGTVSVSPKLRAKVAAQDTVFVVAKSADGKGPPLAVQRFAAADLPFSFKLDDSLAILPGRSISTASEVLITVKLSKTGSADEKPGDLVGVPVKAKVGSSGLKIELSAER